MSQFRTQEYNINELTNGDGTGSLDSLLKSLKSHLWGEYENNRIRGTDYANAYIETIKHGLGTISQYTLERAKLPLELQLLEAQVQKLATDTIVATKQGGLIDAQIYKEMAHTQQIEFETANKLPKEVELLQTQIANGQMDLALKEYDLKYTKPEQVNLLKVEFGLKQFDLEHLKPQELANAKLDGLQKQKQLTLTDREIDLKAKQLSVMDAQISQMHKETALKEFELKQLKPKELELLAVKLEIDKQELELRPLQIELTREEIALKRKQIAMMAVEIGLKEKQLALAEKELAIKAQELTLKAKQLQLADYELQYKLPAEVGSINAQARLYGQKVITEQAQTDGSPIRSGSVIYYNNKVLEQQALSFRNDAKIKVSSIYADLWKVARNTDPDNTSFQWQGQISSSLSGIG